MNERKLTNQEVEKLFSFVKSKYVNFIDVQHELVDHLACDIEELQLNDPNLSFEKALQTVYSKYPITGFSNLKVAKQKAMSRYWSRIYWGYIKEYLKLPKIILTLLLTFLFFKLFQNVGNTAIFLCFGVATLLSFVHMHQTNKQFTQNEKTKYLVINSYLGVIGFSSFIAINIIVNYTDNILFKTSAMQTPIESNFWGLVMLAIMASYYTIIFPALFYVFPEKLQSDIAKKISLHKTSKKLI